MHGTQGGWQACSEEKAEEMPAKPASIRRAGCRRYEGPQDNRLIL